MTSDPVELPGFGLPLDSYDPYEHFPKALAYWAGEAATVRERTMLALMDSITDKPEWDRKIFDESIIQKWRQEAVDSDMDVSEKMLDWIIAELQDKARSCQQDGLIPTLDLDATIVKSDTAIPRELKQALQAACKPLEDVPSRLKDWHPGSNEKVLDLVHPSLFPLVYGRTKIIPKGRIDLKACIDYIGKGEATKAPDDSEIYVSSYSQAERKVYSVEFQWLPCQVEFAGSEAVSITSYINNLHPAKYSSLYNVIEACIAKTVPLWNRTLSSLQEPGKLRIDMDTIEYCFPQGKEPPADYKNDGGETPQYEREDDWLESTRVLVQPEPKEYKRADQPVNVDLRKQFQESGVQVIVKLANIELSPEKPTYEGGSWHVEGQFNEQICASALYYYDCENITESHLAFRQRVKDDEEWQREKTYEQGDHDGVEEIYGIESNGPMVQEIGRVLTREGRLLVFPNALQHRVCPFGLRDPSMPGHRKILALFLVDPHLTIISTANVPPQQKEWWIENLAERRSLSMLPQELADQVFDEVKDGVMTLEEAKEIRLRLMEERKAAVVDLDNEMQNFTFNFCEH